MHLHLVMVTPCHITSPKPACVARCLFRYSALALTWQVCCRFTYGTELAVMNWQLLRVTPRRSTLSAGTRWITRCLHLHLMTRLSTYGAQQQQQKRVDLLCLVLDPLCSSTTHSDANIDSDANECSRVVKGGLCMYIALLFSVAYAVSQRHSVHCYCLCMLLQVLCSLALRACVVSTYQDSLS